MRAPQHLDVLVADDGRGQPRFHADDVVAVLFDRGARGADVGELQILRVALRQDPGAPDVHEHAALLRAGFRDRDDRIDAVGAGRARIDVTRDAVLQAERGAFHVASRVRMDVDQARHDELAACVEHARAAGIERGLDGGDAARGDPEVAHGVEPKRRIDHATALDHEVEPRGLSSRAGVGEHHGARGAGHEVASSQHAITPWQSRSSLPSGA